MYEHGKGVPPETPVSVLMNNPNAVACYFAC